MASQKAPTELAADEDKRKTTRSIRPRPRLSLTAENRSQPRVRNQGKVSQTAGKGSQQVAVTRHGKTAPIQLAALAPASGGVTLLGQPTIWWWQSESTTPKELEFTLYKVGKRTRAVFSIKLGACESGYRAIDLSDDRINPEKVSLEPGGEYKWTLSCGVRPSHAKDSPTTSTIEVFMARDCDEQLEQLLAEPEITGETLGRFSDSGNWYELFDLVAFSSKLNPEDDNQASLREELLSQVNLGGKTKP